MIKAAIKSVVSHLTIVHVLRGSGCVGDRVTTGFAQQGYWSCYYGSNLSSADLRL